MKNDLKNKKRRNRMEPAPEAKPARMLVMYARLMAEQVMNKFYYMEPHHSRSIMNVTCRILDRL